MPDEPCSKINTCVQNVFNIWKENAENRSTQLIFSDLGVPQTKADIKKKGKRFCVYDDIKAKLIKMGVPEKEIAFIHDAKNEEQKDRLFADVRSGKVRVLIGSTAKMGAGTNVQDLLIASHDLDAPYRPSDMEQRRGRMVRQKNKNKTVRLFRYVTEGTFDAYIYQMLENKQRFISQIMTSKAPVRSCQDVDEVTLSYAEIKALSAGNPLIKEKMDLDISVTKLKMLKANHMNTQFQLETSVLKTLPEQIASLKTRIDGIKADIESFKVIPVKKDDDGNRVFPSMTVDGKLYTDKEQAGEALLNAIRHTAFNGSSGYKEIGKYQGFTITAAFDAFSKNFRGELKGSASHPLEFGSSELGNITRLDNALGAMEKELEKATARLEGCTKQFEDAKSELGKPFPYEDDLKNQSARLDELTVLLDADAKKDTPSEKTVKAEITDPYYKEVTVAQLQALKESGLNLEASKSDGVNIVKINRKDRDTMHAVLDALVQRQKRNL